MGFNRARAIFLIVSIAACGEGQKSSEVRRGIFETNRGIMELSYELIDGRAIFQGDIILPLEHELGPQLGPQLGRTGSALRTSGAGQVLNTFRWPDNTVPWTFDSGLPQSTRDEVNDAIDHWEAKTSFNFVARTTETDYVRFIDGSSCASMVGRVGGRQDIVLDEGCSTGNAIHEIGHAVGLWHEQSRFDRDGHVEIHEGEIESGRENNFDIYSSGMDYGFYDFGSVMHYSSDAFATGGDPTITRKDGTEFTVQRDGLSNIDRQSVEDMYSDSHGRAIATGDFNGDGNIDLAVGAPRAGTPRAGRVDIYWSNGTSLQVHGSYTETGLAMNNTSDLFGYALAAGDFNNDGIDDLAVGAPGEDIGTASGTGAVFVFLGSTTPVASNGSLIPTAMLDQTGLGSNETQDRFGWSLAAGDFNNDGRDDLAVGAPGDDRPGAIFAGYVFLFRGVSTGLSAWTGFDQSAMWANEHGDSFGFSLAAGDFNMDGRDDLAVGAPYEKLSGPYEGFVFIFRGTSTGLTAWKGLSQGTLATPANDDLFGAALATGDLNGDGRDDLAVGAPGKRIGSSDQAGQVFIYAGSSTGPNPVHALTQSGLGSDERADGFGSALVFGDFDGDGDEDLAVGGPGESPGAQGGSGFAFIFRATPFGFTAWHGLDQDTLGANQGGDRFAAALGAGDFNGDNRVDLAIGAPGEVTSNGQTGYAFTYRGGTSSLAPSQPIAPNL